jgi:hypothetical protein
LSETFPANKIGNASINKFFPLKENRNSHTFYQSFNIPIAIRDYPNSSSADEIISCDPTNDIRINVPIEYEIQSEKADEISLDTS